MLTKSKLPFSAKNQVTVLYRNASVLQDLWAFEFCHSPLSVAFSAAEMRRGTAEDKMETFVRDMMLLMIKKLKDVETVTCIKACSINRERRKREIKDCSPALTGTWEVGFPRPRS